MKEIKLTQGQVALVDDEDYDFLNQWKWYAHKGRKDGLFYAGKRNNGDIKQIWMHRLIMNTSRGLTVDHIDHNGLNNQKCNLRNCSMSQNKMNVTPIGLSKFLGVHPRNDKYVAQIKVNGKKIYIGTFKTEEDAAHAYDNAAKKYFGEFANLNFKE